MGRKPDPEGPQPTHAARVDPPNSHTTLVAFRHAEVGCSPKVTQSMITQETAKAAPKENLPMIHDLVLALVFLAMIIAPALLAMRSDREEKDIL